MPATYTISPQPYETVFDDLGAICAGALIYTYASGSSTPVDTFSDSIGTKNSNPIQADGAGRFVAFLQVGQSYKFTYKTSAGVLIKTVDGIAATGTTSVQASDISVCHGRLTLTTGVPVTTGDVTAATTVFFTPYQGNQIALYDGVQWSIYTFSELSLSLATFTANKNSDLFAFVSSGAVAIERLEWTNDTTRATALTTQNGILVKSGDATRRYLGTFRTTNTIGQCEDSLTKRLVWNYDHRVPRPLARFETTGSWNYSTATYRQANGSTANQVETVVGVAEVPIDLTVLVSVANGAAGVAVNIAIGVDSTTTPTTGNQTIPYVNTQSANNLMILEARYVAVPAAGWHKFVWLEISAAVPTTTWYGNGAGNSNQSGIVGSVDG